MTEQPLHIKVENWIQRKDFEYSKSPEIGNGFHEFYVDINIELRDLLVSTQEESQRLCISFYPFSYVPDRIRRNEQHIQIKGSWTTEIGITGEVSVHTTYIGGDHHPTEYEIELIIEHAIRLGQEYDQKHKDKIASICGNGNSNDHRTPPRQG